MPDKHLVAQVCYTGIGHLEHGVHICHVVAKWDELVFVWFKWAEQIDFFDVLKKTGVVRSQA